MNSWPESQVQIARFSRLEDLDFGNWLGTPIEMGGRGGVVRMWGVHYSIAQASDPEVAADTWHNALSSNPEHAGELGLGLDELVGSPAIYGTSLLSDVNVIAGTDGRANLSLPTRVIPLYGIVRPRRQIWVLYIVGILGSARHLCELYYSELKGTPTQEAAINRKFGKYRRS